MMFEFDIEDVKNDLEGMSFQEKMEELESLSDNLNLALSEIMDLQQELNDEYESSVYDPLLALLLSLAKHRRWDNLINIDNPVITVHSIPQKVKIWASWDTDEWTINIELANFIASNTKRYKALSDFASLLRLPYEYGNEEISWRVSEENLEDALLSLVFVLCGDEYYPAK